MATTITVTLNGFLNDVLDARDRILVLDLTGDGTSDFLWYRPGGGFAGAYLSNGDGTLRFVPYRDFRGAHNGFQGDVMDSRDTAVPIDLRGDGRTGFLWYRPGAGYAGAYLSNGDGTLTYVSYRDPRVAKNNGNDNGFTGDVMATQDRAVPLDLRGDGKTGFLWYRPGAGYAGAYLSNGDGKLTYVSYRDPRIARNNGNDNGFAGDVMDSRDTAVPIDLRGDGRTGFLWYRPGTGYAGAYLSNGDGSLTYVSYRDPRIARNNGNDNGFGHDVMDARDRAVPLDLRGDGKTGFLWYRPGTGYAGAYLSNGDGKLTYVSYRDPQVARNNGNDNGFTGDVMDSRDTAVPIDLRGDGKTGFLWYRPGTGYAGAYLSRGDGGLTYVSYRDPHVARNNGNANGFTGDVMDSRDCAVPLDLRGDRKTGFLWCRPGAGYASAYLSRGDGSLTPVTYATATTVDKSSWMEGLKEHIAFTQLNELAIPGAHDAGTYGMVGPACNQGLDVYGQLCSGARYLDLRVIWNKNSEIVQIPIRDPAYYMYHGNFVSDNTLAAVLDQIQRFASEHPFEILLLDFAHLYQEEGKDAPTARRQVWNMLSERLGSLLVTRDVLTKVDVNHPGYATPDVLWSAGRRIVVFAEDASLSLGIPWLWSRSAITSDYKDTDRPNDLLDYLDTAVKGTRPNLFWILQTQLTPTKVEAIAAGAAGLPLLQTMAAGMNPLIVDRLQNAWRDVPLNIVSGDWIHTSAFCDAVLRTQRCRPRR